MTDLRTQLPICPLEYQVPHIPSNHTALVIKTHAEYIDAEEKILPWTLASLINNTDLIMKGVHLKIVCESKTRSRIQKALKRFDLPDNTICLNVEPNRPIVSIPAYQSICMLDINYWAFRGNSAKANDIKLPLGHLLRYNWAWGTADYIFNKNTWMGIHLNDPQWEKNWRDAANTAVYGEDYKQEGKNISGYFVNENEPNWNLDASILQFQTKAVDNPKFIEFNNQWAHLGTDTLIALWLLKTKQHAYNFRDTLFIDTNGYAFSRVPQLCYMKHASKDVFRHATQQLMSAH